jgi:4-carboxymuconolactone decarboxylase
MTELPDPRPQANATLLAEMQRAADARGHADGRAELAAVYVAMFNNPGVARCVAALGEHLRFGWTLPDQVREAAILRYAGRCGLAYEWAHHVRPARLAGLREPTIMALAGAAVPSGLDPVQRAAVEAVDQVRAGEEISDGVQRVLADSVGYAGVVELVALCGLYALVGYMTTAFAIDVEAGLPALPALPAPAGSAGSAGSGPPGPPG